MAYETRKGPGKDAQRRELIDRLLEKKGVARGSTTTSDTQLSLRRDVSGKKPLSFAQRRLWFLQQIQPKSTAYNVPIACRLTGSLDRNALEGSLREILRRHEVLRTTFRSTGGEPVQVIHSDAAFLLPVEELGSVAAREQEVFRFASMEARRPFDLSTGPLLRASLLRLEEQEHILLLTAHHIIFDDWSMGVFVHELSELYRAFRIGNFSPLSRLPIQYSDWALWQRERLQGEVLQGQLSYWKRQFADTPAPIELPSDYPRPVVKTFAGATMSAPLSESVMRAVEELARREGATLFMALLAVWKVLAYRYTAQPDVVVGSPIANRNRAETEGLIGFFVNTLALRTDLSGNPTFRELLGRVRETALGAYAHQDLPFERLVEELNPERDPSHNPLFQLWFAMEDVSISDLALEDVTVRPLDVHTGTAKFDVSLFVSKAKGSWECAFEYDTQLFTTATIERMAGHFATLLKGIVDDPDRSICELPVLTEQERHTVLYRWNDTKAALPEHACVHQVFEEQARRDPRATAATFESNQLTYGELNQRANQLARLLQRLGVGPDVLVGLCTERSLEMLIGMMGVLKAGGAYLPLDPSLPKERIEFMLKDTAVPIVLTQQRVMDRLPEHPARVLQLDADHLDPVQESVENTLVQTTPENLAYVTYTSGSTGEPKGIAMPHRPLLNLLSWQQRHYGYLPDRSKTLQFASLSFDVSFQDIFAAWSTGGTVAIISEEQRQDVRRLPVLLERESVQRLFIPAVALQQMAEGNQELDKNLAELCTVIAGSEQLIATENIVRLFSRSKSRALHNEYGPSETHVVTVFDLPNDTNQWPKHVPVGRPISNARIYVLDEEMGPVPVGVTGELYIGGAGVARGYLGRPGLTAERFVPDPFSGESGARLYRTGDLARWLANGDLEFLGRADHQVKVRGFRVELGEVEAVLERHPEVTSAVVVAREDAPGDKRLVAYYTSRQHAKLGTSILRSFLSRKLPDYMLPSTYVGLEKLPFTPNGKVDRKSLPVPDALRPQIEDAFVAPRTEMENALALVWAQVLNVDRVGANDNFFELGGHSLLATQVVSRIREDFGIEVPLRSIFEAPTVSRLAESVTRGEGVPVARSSAAKVASATAGIGKMVDLLEDMSEDEVGSAIAEREQDVDEEMRRQ